jgi:hypothetical protein
MNPNNPGQIGFMAGSAALAQKSGYCYIYIANESDDLVYFDNFTLSHEMPPNRNLFSKCSFFSGHSVWPKKVDCTGVVWLQPLL